MKDYYKILGVTKQASAEEIKKTYRKLAKQYHPDVVKDNKEKLEHMYEIQEAYACLGDDERRKQYDEDCAKAARKFTGVNGAVKTQPRPDGRSSPEMSQFERFFGFQPGKGPETYQDKKAQKPEGPIKPEEMFAAFFGNMNQKERKK